ncbi:MAG: alpha/beta hydrolase [Chloroflexota bacterium]
MRTKNKRWRYWLRLFVAAVLSVFLGILILVMWGSYRQTQAYLRPPRVIASGDFLRANKIEYQIIELTTEDGINLRAFYTPPQNGAVILVAHGHAGTIPEDIYAMFARYGYGVLAWEFRAHGESGGDFTSLGYYEVLDMKAALDYALSQPHVEHVGAWGGSMGAVTSIRAGAAYSQIEAVVADSAFDTLEGVFEVRVPYPTIRPFIRFFAEMETGLNQDVVRPVDEIGRISPRPVFLIQGLGDYSIPYRSAENLYAAAGEPKYFWEGEKAGHLGMYGSFVGEYKQRVIEFFEEYLK